jgi:hypothetical protein
MVSGNDQNAPVGSVLPDSLVARVLDADEAPVAGVQVTWAAANGGQVSAATTTTGSDGETSVRQTLGPAPGVQTVTATARGLQGSPITFTQHAVAVAEPAALSLTTEPPAGVVNHEVFDPSMQPAVMVEDAAGNPVPNIEVTASLASGSGTLEGAAIATSGDDGVAHFGDLGIAGTGAFTLQFTSGQLTATSSAINVDPLPAEATAGKWDALVSWPIVPLHMHLLPTGKILAWGRFEQDGSMGEPHLWDPGSGAPIATAVKIPADTMLFCAGHTFMADGRLMVSGGHKDDDEGLDVTNIFDPVAESWVPGLPKMAKGRWYPTVTLLPDGRLVTVAGRDTTKTVVAIPEIWENARWVQLPGASLDLPYYPRDFLAPDGRVFYAGERVVSRWLDVDASTPNGRGKWTTGPAHIWPFNREYGSAVMYEPGKILYVGGGGDLNWSTQDPKSNVPTATAEQIDLTVPSPAWRSAGSMSAPRRHLNATILPDGTVLVAGGLSGGGFNDLSTGVRAAELWDPKTDSWSTLASNAVTRGYHSVSLLLPDATVLHGASGDAKIPGTNTPYPNERSHEIFHPPYLYKGARPVITSAPPVVGYGQVFPISTPNAAQVTEVRWIRLGSVTHAFDADQRANTLTFAPIAGAVNVTAPQGPNLAPPGYYQLFILNRNGVPSTGAIIRLQ